MTHRVDWLSDKHRGRECLRSCSHFLPNVDSLPGCFRGPGRERSGADSPSAAAAVKVRQRTQLVSHGCNGCPERSVGWSLALAGPRFRADQRHDPCWVERDEPVTGENVPCQVASRADWNCGIVYKQLEMAKCPDGLVHTVSAFSSIDTCL